MATPYDEPPERLLNAEQIEYYRPGGLHPVHIGHTFKAERYKVIRKLGHGSSSTVWLAKDARYDLSGHRYVALKILSAEASKASKETAIHGSLNADEAVRRHVVIPLDHFKHLGPNGEHDCLVLELMRPSVVSLFERSIPYRLGRSLSKQMLATLQALHGPGIVCYDLHPGNMLLRIRCPTNDPSDDGRSIPTRRKGVSSVPERIYEDWPLTEFWNRSAPAQWNLCDLGAACPFDEPPQHPSVPVALRPPEVILQSAVDFKVDIWSFACYLFEIFSAQPLFSLLPFYPHIDNDELYQSDGDDEDHELQMKDDEHLLQMIDTLGMLPADMLERWPRRTKYLNQMDGGKIFNPFVSFPGDTLEQKVANRMPPEMTAKERVELLHALRLALQYDSRTRPSATELLSLDWFQKCDA